MINLLNDEKLRNEMIGKGLERVLSFSWKKTAEQTLSVYQSLSTGNQVASNSRNRSE
jgi:glycosyltransferase involved in cell wall biosynthesis